MSVTIRIPSVLRQYAGGETQLSIPASDVRSSLLELKTTHPALYRCVCDETGAVRRHINVFVNLDHMRDLSGLDTKLDQGDELTILPAVSGG